ncbi:MAG: hypothetical protein K6T17_02090 [Fimbriimonadales bacterium]|nr:hypothetical protein [Fimbriimonadales bacterium]
MKIGIIIAAIVVTLGLVFGLGFTGIIKIPGITPKKQAQNATKEETPEEKVAQTPKEATAKPSNAKNPKQTNPSAPSPNSKDGSERLAKIWSLLDAETVAEILKGWNDQDAIPVLTKMEDKKLAEILSALPPERAAKLSQKIKNLPQGAS